MIACRCEPAVEGCKVCPVEDAIAQLVPQLAVPPRASVRGLSVGDGCSKSGTIAQVGMLEPPAERKP